MNILHEAVIYLAGAALCVPLAKRIGLGSVLGYVLAGVVIGPWALALIPDPQSVLNTAEIGVVFLLFLIGVQLQPSRLWIMRTSIFGLGSLQVGLTTAALALPAWQLGYDPVQSLVIGFALSLSSTAFALQLLAEKQGLLTAYGRSAFGILLFQDVVVIPAMVLVPLLARDTAAAAVQFSLLEFLQGLGAVIVYLVLLRYLLRPALRMIAATQLHEMFTIASLLIVITSALVMEAVGLSMGLGAFLAGVLVADSEYRHQLQADIEPFKGLLLGLFFIAVGMSTNVGLLLSMPLVIIGLSLSLILIKSLLLYAVSRIGKLDNANALQLAAYLSQGGEFGFIVFSFAVDASIIAPETRDILVLTITLSMIATPFLLLVLKQLLAGVPTPPAKTAYDDVSVAERSIVIAGFGRFGQVVGRILRSQRLSFTAIEIDPGHVDFVRQYGNEIYYGDAASIRLLRTAGVDKAAAFVCAVGDVEKSVAIVDMVEREFPNVRVYARARNRLHEMRLRAIGVDGVIRDTLLSSVELAGMLLGGLGRADEEVAQIKRAFLENDRATLQKQYAHRENERMLIQTAKEAAEELERVFSEDEEAGRRQGQAPDA